MAHRCTWLALALMLLQVVNIAQAGQLSMLAGGVSVNVPVMSYKERKFSTVLAQRYDYSCGSAAVASLLTYHYDDRVTEAEVFEGMYEHGDQAKITREGFSLLDMKQYLNRRGYSAEGYRVPLDKLVENHVPAVVLLNQDGYLHFVIIKGVTGQRVLVGDPALGIKAMRRKQFEDMWNGIVFVILNYRTLAQEHFNKPGEWDLWAKAPLGNAMTGQSLASFTLARPGNADF